jgi:hypothetical protein
MQLQQLLLVKVRSEDPHTLDFTHTFCFDCSREELYRVSFVPIRDPSTIEDPVLRFQCALNCVASRSLDPRQSKVFQPLEADAGLAP